MSVDTLVIPFGQPREQTNKCSCRDATEDYCVLSLVA